MQFSGCAVRMAMQRPISHHDLMELMLPCARYRSALVLVSLSTGVLHQGLTRNVRRSCWDLRATTSSSSRSASNKRPAFAFGDALRSYLDVAPTPTHSQPVGLAVSLTGYTGSCGQFPDRTRSSAAGGRTSLSAVDRMNIYIAC